MADEEIEDLIEKKVNEVFRNIMSDLDYGLELKPEFEKRLEESIEAEKEGRVKSLKEVLKSTTTKL